METRVAQGARVSGKPDAFAQPGSVLAAACGVAGAPFVSWFSGVPEREREWDKLGCCETLDFGALVRTVVPVRAVARLPPKPQILGGRIDTPLTPEGRRVGQNPLPTVAFPRKPQKLGGPLQPGGLRRPLSPKEEREIFLAFLRLSVSGSCYGQW